MKQIMRHTAAFVCAAALTFGLAGCGQSAQTSGSETTAPAGQEQRNESNARDETAPTADGRIDVTTTGDKVATYRGAKYIVSDVTADQKTGEELTEGLGTQEICVVNQPESWQNITSIGWDRNNLRYEQIEMPWGTASIRYTYVNEASAVDGIEEWSQSSEESYFSGVENVEHTKVGDHTIAYLFEDVSGEEQAMSLEEQAAAMEDEGYEPSGRTVAVYAFEQRGDKCALLTSVSGIVTDDGAVPTAEELIKLAYEPLSFAKKGDSVNAASFVSDFTLTNLDGSASVVIARKDDALISYTEHTASLLGESSSDEAIAMTTYDFAPTVPRPDDAEQHEIDGRTVAAQMGEGQLYAWVDVDGSELYIEATVVDDDTVDAVLERVLAGRIVS